MRQTPDGLILSATDVSNALACRRLTGLDMEVAAGLRKRPFRPDPLADILRERGLAHEKAYVDALRARGLDVVDVRYEADREEATLAAMAAGREVIVQGALRDGRWFGLPDVLLKVARSGRWDWSYEAVDTKLAQETKAGAILQLGLYSELLKAAQGVAPEYFRVVTPLTLPGDEAYRVDDYAAYVRLIRRRLEETAALPGPDVVEANYPEPVNHCEVCAFWSGCDAKRRADDHLSLVAGASRSQRREFEENGITTLTALAACKTLDFRPKRGAVESLLRVRDQADVQFRSRGLETPLHELRPRVEKQGFERLPEPSPGDVFLDLEGDPFAVEGGREYLFGVVTAGAEGTARYQAWWALTHAEEAKAFAEVVDFIEARRAAHPDMHVYHYAPYEPSAFKRLMGRHALRESAIDALLRGGHFVDLYAVVTQSLLAGVERYSIKNLEPLYGFERDVPLEDARGGLRAMERCLETGIMDIDPAVRQTVQGYNEDDCVSTLRLRDWLEGLRAAEVAKGIEIPRPAPEESEASAEVDEKAQRVEALRAPLLAGVPDEPSQRSEEEQARWLLAYMLDWHRREDKAAWWEYFRLSRDLAEEDLFPERQAVAGLEFVERVEEIRSVKGKLTGSVIDRYRYPLQEMEMREGDTLKTRDGKKFGDLQSFDRLGLTLDIRKGSKVRDTHPSSVFVHNYISSAAMEEAIDRIADAVVTEGGRVDPQTGSHRVARDLLLRSEPRLRSGPFERSAGESIVDFAVRAACDIESGVLAIQGPPGAGKTYAGSRMICKLVKQGRKVGVVATSHRVILNLLAAVLDSAAGDPAVKVAHRGSEDELVGGDSRIALLPGNPEAEAALRDGTANVVGGTAWLWSRPEFAGLVDVLFVDEAGQMSLTNVVASSQSASALVLLGDPQQLDQPVKGSHPEGLESSALGHMLAGERTIPEDRGIFLPVTWRLAPSISALTSELFYEGRLQSKPGLEAQRLVNTGSSGLDGSGLWLCAVDHDGNRNSSLEEIDAIEQLVAGLLDGRSSWIDEHGKAALLSPDDILIVAPYNAQVTRLAERLDSTGVRVGTVDKFQGQEAPVVIYSMATSRPEDAPRGMEFLYSLNRLNVATSRARCAVIVVASPRLFEPECASPRQIRLANALCRYREVAGSVSASVPDGGRKPSSRAKRS